MVFVDSCDSVLMLSAYALPEITRGKGWKGWQLLEKPDSRDGKTEDEDEEKLPEWEEKSLLRMMVGLTLVSIVMALLISIVSFCPSIALTHVFTVGEHRSNSWGRSNFLDLEPSMTHKRLFHATDWHWQSALHVPTLPTHTRVYVRILSPRLLLVVLTFCFSPNPLPQLVIGGDSGKN